MIDWMRVTTLRDEIGAEGFDEVVELFMAEVEETIARLRTTPDLSRLEGDLHFLKGSALDLGFSAFSTLCQNGETASAKGAANTVDVAAIINCFDISKQSFVDKLQTALAN